MVCSYLVQRSEEAHTFLPSSQLSGVTAGQQNGDHCPRKCSIAEEGRDITLCKRSFMRHFGGRQRVLSGKKALLARKRRDLEKQIKSESQDGVLRRYQEASSLICSVIVLLDLIYKRHTFSSMNETPS